MRLVAVEALRNGAAREAVCFFTVATFIGTSSVRGPAASDRQARAGDGAAVRAAEKRGERADLARLREGLGGHVLQEHVLDHLVLGDAVGLGLLVDLLLDQRGPDVTGADR